MKFLGNYFQMGDSPTPDRVLGDFIYAEETAQGRTTSTAAPGTTYLSTTKELLAGTYLVTATLGWGHSAANKDGYLLLRHGTTTVRTYRDRNSAAGAVYRFPATLRARVVIPTAGSNTFSISFYTSTGTMYINGAELTVERIA